MVGLISGWLGVAEASAAEKPNEDEDTVGGLSQALAEILASLQATFAGTPLDVEISYEGGRDVSLKSSCSSWAECLASTLTNSSSICCDACWKCICMHMGLHHGTLQLRSPLMRSMSGI
jgi:hypothetical protein